MIPQRVHAWIVIIATFAICSHVNIQNGVAQDSTAVTQIPDPATNVTPPEAQDSSIDKRKLAVKEVTGEIGLHHTVTVEIDNLSEYLQKGGKSPNKFILYLDGRPLKGMRSRLGPDHNMLMFDIEPYPDSKSEWTALIRRPFIKDRGFTYEVPVSVGYEDEKPILSSKEYKLDVINKTWFWIFLAFFAFVLSLFLRLAKNSNILRDPSADQLPNGQRGTYSLGRTQMAFWFFLVAMSYVLIWMLTDDRGALSESALGLLGISSATALGAALVGSSKKTEAESKLKTLNQEHGTLTARLNDLKPQLAALSPAAISRDLSNEQSEKDARLTQVVKEVNVLKAEVVPQQSEGFLRDILTDVHGITLHRFQVVIWTIVLGIIFVSSVYNSAAMPEFNGTLLALMGISGGTYIGFKFPEKHG